MKVINTIYKILSIVGIEPKLTRSEETCVSHMITLALNENVKDIRVKTNDYKDLDLNKCYVYEGFESISDKSKFYYHVNFDARNSTLVYNWEIYKHGVLIYESKQRRFF